MSFHLCENGIVHRTTTLHGYSAITMVESWVDGRWVLARRVPRGCTEISEDVARERVGDEPSRFAEPLEGGGGLNARVKQLDEMIEATVAWLRASAVGSDAELAWASPGSWDREYEMDSQEAMRGAAELIDRMLTQRDTILFRNANRPAPD
ncbi:hypothetical protein [Allokutzneria sp. NRRL B-24872]|uniref:hypothetical protein n=1 Tax=Allokutzneria sp. NRRL B-24872 TaxID=1137961 RepID=UPI000A3B81F4|nr:hypothetical protein [Allokutzneria sp. NRRL B-24872]